MITVRDQPDNQTDRIISQAKPLRNNREKIARLIRTLFSDWHAKWNHVQPKMVINLGLT
jgi:hypothetical protein